MKNIFVVTGNIGGDAILKDIDGKKVINFSLASDEGYVNKGGTKVEKTAWIECEMWDSEKLAPYLKKGATVSVTGSVSARFWNNKDTGEAVGNLRLRIRELQLCDKKPKNADDTTPTEVTDDQNT